LIMLMIMVRENSLSVSAAVQRTTAVSVCFRHWATRFSVLTVRRLMLAADFYLKYSQLIRPLTVASLKTVNSEWPVMFQLFYMASRVHHTSLDRKRVPAVKC